MTPIDGYVALAREIGFGSPASVVAALAELRGSAEEVADGLRARHLLTFVQRAIHETDSTPRITAELSDALASRRPIQRTSPGVLLETFAEIRRDLAHAGVEALLLKGLVLAERLYGGIDRRPQFDVDVLVRRRDLRRAARVLLRSGFAPEAYDLHSRTVIRAGVKVDLHGALRWAPAFRLEEESIWATRREISIGDVDVPTLSDEHTLLLLLLAAFEDLGQASVNLKQLLDVALLLRDLEPGFDWDGFAARRASENLLGVAVNMLAFATDVFAMRAAVPRLDAVLAAHAPLVRHRDRKAALDLLAASPKAATNLRWFARVYPGSIAVWLLWFWAAGFPANLGQIGRPWLAQARGVATERTQRRSRPA